jgi:predicted RNA-binding protein with PUA-like domain
MARTRHWLTKSEPSTYSYDQLVKDGGTRWDGVRNFEARNNLRAMAVGDLCLFYHSNEGKAVVGVARVSRAAYQDPTTEEDWSCVDVEPLVAFARPVTLDEIRARKGLAGIEMLKRNRLSVTHVTAAEFKTILKMGATELPDA